MSNVEQGPVPFREPVARNNYTTYDAANGFPTAPVDKFVVLYLRSGGLAQPTAPRVDEQGSDIIGDGSQLHPFYSAWGVWIRYGRKIEEGLHVLVKFAGGLSDAAKLAGVNPWYGQCDELRQYPARGLDLFSGEAYVNNLAFEGPLKGRLLAGQPVVGNIQPVGAGTITANGRTRFRNTGSQPTPGTLLRTTRAGRLVTFQMQITDADADYFYVDCGNFTAGGSIFAANGLGEPTDTFEFISHAAEIIPTSRTMGVDAGVGGADGISLTGIGAANIHGRLTNGANARFTFTMLGFENLNIRGARGISFDRCFFYHSFNVFDSSVSFRGCQTNAQIPTKYVNSQVNVYGEASSVDEQAGSYPSVAAPFDEYDGDLSAPDALLLKPINLSTGGVSMFHYYATLATSGGAIIQGGRYEPRFGATFVGGLVLQGGARFVHEAPEYPVLFRGVHSSGTAAALWVKGDSVAILGLRNITLDDMDHHFRVGARSSTAIELGDEFTPASGTLRDPATWNGNFCRYAVTGGYPSGDFSAIRDNTKYPA